MGKPLALTPEQHRQLGLLVRSAQGQLGDAALSRLGTLARRLPQGCFAVACTIDGGSAGPPCTYTYTVKTVSSDRTLGTSLTPDAQRIPIVAYAATPADSVGIAYMTDEINLLWANELPNFETCPEALTDGPIID